VRQDLGLEVWDEGLQQLVGQCAKQHRKSDLCPAVLGRIPQPELHQREQEHDADRNAQKEGQQRVIGPFDDLQTVERSHTWSYSLVRRTSGAGLLSSHRRGGSYAGAQPRKRGQAQRPLLLGREEPHQLRERQRWTDREPFSRYYCC
jgi:hypothetical protein